MFLKTYMEMPADFESVRATMVYRPCRWLEGLAVAAEQEGRRLLVAVGLEAGATTLRRTAWLDVGEAITTDRVASLPLWLHLQGHDRLFPSLEGSLDAAWLGSGRTHLALAAQYDPPFGVLGGGGDRALLHRVAETVAHRFLAAAATRLAENAVPVTGPAGRPRQEWSRSPAE
jgi:hypothetical protein